MIPPEFQRLDQLIPSAICAVAYATAQNFLGRVISGYDTPLAYLKSEPAQALKKISEKAARDGYHLVIYDAYRPQRAVQEFLSWKDEPNNEHLASLYYPDYKKADLFQKGYISKRSMHSTGYAVDLSLIGHDQILKEPTIRSVSYQGKDYPVLDDGTLWMGGHFDWFHPLSHPSNSG